MHAWGHSHPLRPDAAARGGWRVDGEDRADHHHDLDAWLARHAAVPMAGRVPVLAYGSNRCPSKITWLRANLGLEGPVVVLRAEVRGLAAVWAAGTRARDGVRPATLAVDPGAVGTHAVWMATPAQVAVLDACEGRGRRYQLVRLRTGTVRTDDGARCDAPDGVWAYWPLDAGRAPLLVDGSPVGIPGSDSDTAADTHTAVDQARARHLAGTPAPVSTRGVSPVDGAPDPVTWPARVFVYGTLAPGRSAWWRLAPHADPAVPPVAAHCAGRVYDTGRGYPAMTAGGTRDRVEGTIVTLADPAAAMPALDAYEGPEYRRARAVAYPRPDPARSSYDGDGDGTCCWLWMWDRPVAGWTRLDGPWR